MASNILATALKLARCATVAKCTVCRGILKSTIHNPRFLHYVTALNCNLSEIRSNSTIRLQHTNSTLGNNDPESEAEIFLANLGPADAKKLQIIKLELSVSQQFGNKVPEIIYPSQWVKLFELGTPSSRNKYAKYLHSIEKKQKSKKEKQQEKQLLRAEQRALEGDEHFKEPKNTIFMLVRSSTMNVFYNSRLVHALNFGPHLVIDLAFEGLMQEREHKNLISQILMAHGKNKLEREPFHFMMTSAGLDNPIMKAFRNSSDQKEMISSTEKSVLDVYPHNRIVYLSPNAPNELTCYDPSDVYVIGGFIDKSNPKPVTMAFAKKHKLRMARFPLDRYLSWATGTKSLTIDQVIKILLDLKRTNDWTVALQHVPTRKLRCSD